MNEEIIIHYNAFQSISEQLSSFNVDKKEMEKFDTIKDYIIYLYLADIITESQEIKCFEKLQKKIVKVLNIGGNK